MDKPSPSRLSWRRFIVTTLIAVAIWMVVTGDLSRIVRVAVYTVKTNYWYSPALAKGNVAGARALFDGDIRAHPSDPAVYEVIAMACMSAKRHDLAREYLERSLLPCRDAPRVERSQLYFMLSMCYTELEQKKPQLQAIFAAQRAMELDPQSPEKLNGYGYLLADNDWLKEEALLRTGQALQMLKKEPRLADSPELPAMVEDSYGWALYKLGRYDEAVSALNQAISDFPNGQSAEPKSAAGEELGTMYYHVGAAYRRQRRFDSARDALQTALRYAPDNKEAKDELADMKSVPIQPAVPAPDQLRGAPAKRSTSTQVRPL